MATQLVFTLLTWSVLAFCQTVYATEDSLLFRYDERMVAECPPFSHQIEFSNNCTVTCPPYASFSYQQFCVEFCPYGMRGYPPDWQCFKTDNPIGHAIKGYSVICQKGFCSLEKEKPFCFNYQCVSVCTQGTFNEELSCVYKCSEMFPVIFNNSCIKECPDSHRYNEVGHCVATCSSGISKRDGTCISKCPEHTYFYNKTCRDVCPSEAPYSIHIWNTSTCVHACPAFTSVNKYKCELSCPNGLDFLWNRTCVHECPLSDPFIYVLKRRLPCFAKPVCLPECPDNTYIDGKTCVATCDAQMFVFNFTCVNKCPPTHRYIHERTCSSTCPNSTVHFNSSCLSKCPANARYLYNLDCYSVCPPSHPYDTIYQPIRDIFGHLSYSYVDSSKPYCVKACDGINTHGAMVFNMTCMTRCPRGLYELNNTCIKQCPKKMIVWGHKCVDNCPSNVLEFNTNCINHCPTKAKYILDGQCISICPSTHPYYSSVYNNPYYFGHEKRKHYCVQACNDTNKSPGDMIYNMTCVKLCPSGFFTLNRTCVKQCPNTMLVLGQACTEHCPVGKVTWKYQCITHCPNTTVLLNSKCVMKCPTSHRYLYHKNNRGSFVDECVSECPGNSFVWKSNCFDQCPEYLTSLSANRSCVRTCPDSHMYRYKFTTNLKYTAFRCQTSCEDQRYIDGDLCVPTCPDTKRYSLARVCLDKCPDKHPFVDAKTDICLTKCASTSVILNKFCYENCPKEAIYLVGNQCKKSCPESLTLISSQSKGDVCDDKCHDPYILENKTCVRSCSKDKVIINNECGEFQYCPRKYKYSEVSKHGLICRTKCLDNQFIDQNRCVEKCPKFYRQDKHCVDECPKVSGELVGGCYASCPQGSFSYKQSCTDTCPDNMFSVEGIRICAKQCPTSHPFVRSIDNRCVKKCDDGQLYDENKKCMEKYECDTTKGFFIYNKEQCVTKCPVHSFRSILGTSCIEVTNGFLVTMSLLLILGLGFYVLACVQCFKTTKGSRSVVHRKSSDSAPLLQEDSNEDLPENRGEDESCDVDHQSSDEQIQGTLDTCENMIPRCVPEREIASIEMNRTSNYRCCDMASINDTADADKQVQDHVSIPMLALETITSTSVQEHGSYSDIYVDEMTMDEDTCVKTLANVNKY